MKELLKVEIFYIELFHIVAICISVFFFVVMVIKAQKGPLLNTLFFGNAMMLLWMVSKVLKTVSPNVDLRWFFIVTQYFGVSMLEAAFLEFAWCYAKGRRFSRKARVLIYILPVLQFLLVCTNPWHFLFYSRYDFWGDSFGALFPVYMVIQYTYILIAIVLCSIKLTRQFQRNKRKNIFLLGIAILMPIIFNILYLTRIFSRLLESIRIDFVFDITPIAFMMSLIIFVYVTFQYSFLDVVPIMQHEIFQKINIPILYTDPAFIYMDGNMAAQKALLPHMDSLPLQSIETSGDSVHELKIENRSYSVYGKQLQTTKRRYINIFIFNEITRYNKIKAELVQKKNEIEKQNNLLEKQIEIIRETSNVAARNYFSRELHDVIGHALVLTIRLSELSMMIYSEQPQEAKVKMEEALHVLKGSFQELKRNISQNNIRAFSSFSLKRDLEVLLQKVNHTSIDAKLYFRGFASNISMNAYDTVIRIVQESMTNVMKYAEASRVIVSVKLDTKIEINISDNGKGCKILHKGNGISGLEQRIRALDGEISYSYGSNKGFQVVAGLPFSPDKAS